MPNIAIFASGAGSNARQIIRFFKNSDKNIRVRLILTNKPRAGVIQVAKEGGVDLLVLSNEDFQKAQLIQKELVEYEIDWIVLAGFLRKIPESLIQLYNNRIINLHPSLLPKYGGKGMFGHHVHEAVINNGEVESGITVHLVNEEYDKGEILFQASCNVDSEDTIEDLVEKIHKLEHEFFPPVIEKQILKNKQN